MPALRDAVNGQFIDTNFGLSEDDESSEYELSTDQVSIYELAPSNDDEEDFDHTFDEELEQTVMSSLLLGSDYDWDDGLQVDIKDWLHKRYGDVIRLNDEFGYQTQTPPAFYGRNRTNVGILPEEEVFRRECRPAFRNQRGYGAQRAPKWQRGWTGRTRRMHRQRYYYL